MNDRELLELAVSAPHDELDLPRFCPEDVRNYLGERSAYGEFPRGDWKERVYAKARLKWAKAIVAEIGRRTAS
ncbi:hypothetical protein ABIF65_004259 [Bradyrhizobium japonicum]|jgi:hypothetical protein|uniref:hypothetical protein n=1 Tax=Bradyrhizobium TaxID=374 RepID=UPI000577768B|nr:MULTISPECIES: hypothetical protein [Bradyrhizobium]MBR0946683.1 hypothetical protein [Bradyrhizobium liaoningense]MBR0999994.1 hypothetical protein [Bradyrhizobium liaoningense]MCP1742574.1 hypothetical protein [Bradyrhizobium japonicum]MCP1860285.1 hypothetical protein [Bradyrhizobium japonicum]MCP1891050.1 hypothetical protein [Bradyrhizobium japonicum]